ncbi:MAG: VWA domain-containing protein [Myxococcales bacterium]|nr:VWA domain-containing protein [Myxococcales bacterium]
MVLLLCLLPACGRTPLLGLDSEATCLELEPDGLSVYTMRAHVDLHRSDILFLIDNSGSMADEIDAIRSRLIDELIPGIKMRVSDPEVGVASFSDFGERKLGERSHPYRLLQPITDNFDAVLRAVAGLEAEEGWDAEESQLEALYQAATGEGLGVFVEAKSDCPTGTRAGVCFREGSFGVIMLVTDAPMRNVTGIGADGELSEPAVFDGLGPDVPYIPYVREYDETLDALRAEGLRVMGLWSGAEEGLDDLRRVALDTGAVDSRGKPVVFDIGSDGQNLGEGVLQGLQELTGGVMLVAELSVFDADESDGFDPERNLVDVRALRAEPATHAQPVAGAPRFEAVRAGADLVFELVFDTGSLPPEAGRGPFPLDVRVETDDGVRIADERLELIVQAPNAGCP